MVHRSLQQSAEVELFSSLVIASMLSTARLSYEGQRILILQAPVMELCRYDQRIIQKMIGQEISKSRSEVLRWEMDRRSTERKV